ncbi:uncharacterized protein LOC102463882 [Pelodiscus sinensis]|uniref:uncharacterized protein LOC102463882 n=1 Tax=Pelodiscus sinensis TaxID=13735 RepID=UPI003F6BF2A0
MAAAAAADSVKRIKAEATCSICLELLRDPVTTACGHSFCKRCITQICQGREDAACPQCRQRLQKGTLQRNQELRSIVELFRSQAEEKPAAGNTCERHQEPLKLYCNEDQTPICLVCMQSQAHRGHTVVPVEEALQEYKGKIAEQLEVIESCCGKLHQFVNQVWKHLPQNEREEEYRSMKRVCEKLTTVLQVRTETPGQRSGETSSQPPASPSPARDVSKETERQGHSGNKPVLESIQQQLQGIESSCEKLHPLVSTDWTDLSQSEREEEHQRLKRVIDNIATLLKVAVKETRKRDVGRVGPSADCPAGFLDAYDVVV